MKNVIVFDVEALGLHGEGFAVAAGHYINGTLVREVLFACDPGLARAERQEDREWIAANVPPLEYNCDSPADVRLKFWDFWMTVKTEYPEVVMAGECVWPVETGFLSACVAQVGDDAWWAGPYPLHDIATMLLAAGMDPLKEYPRRPDELPKHHPLADVRQSARLLHTAVARLGGTISSLDLAHFLAHPEDDAEVQEHIRRGFDDTCRLGTGRVLVACSRCRPQFYAISPPTHGAGCRNAPRTVLDPASKTFVYETDLKP